jgi:ankyrin repeat protein
LAQGVDPNVPHEGETALTAAAGPAANIKKVAALLQAGADVNLPNAQGQTALDKAVYSDCINTVKALIAAGADVTQARKHSIFCGPARMGRTDFVHVLLEAGASPSRHIRKILSLASDYGDAAMVRAILTAHKRKVDKRALVQPLVSAASRGNLEMMNLLIQAGADPTIEPREDLTALMKASSRGFNDIVQTLLLAGAPPDIQNATATRTALMRAASMGHTGTMHILLEHKASPSLVESRGHTALMIACEFSQTEAVRVLLEHKADPNQASRIGTTALMIAAEKGLDDIVRLLLEYGADSQLRDKSLNKKGGCSAEDLATGEAKAMLVACRERQKLREVSGVKDTDVPVRKKRIM